MLYKPSIYKQLFHTGRRFLAKYWLSLMPAIQIAITGSQGKTNTTRVIAHILSLPTTVVTDHNLDTIYNVPITALKVMPWTKFAVFELGIDQPNEMNFHLQIVKPKIAVVTGISPVHTDSSHLRSLRNLILEKRKLIEALPRDGFAVLNYDDPNVRSMAAHTQAKILWYGTDPKHCDIWVDPKSIKLSLEGTSFQLISTNFNQFQPISTKLIGRHHIYTLMATFLVIYAATNFNQFQPVSTNFNQALTSLYPLQGRMSLDPGPFGTTILNDSLRANPASTESGLKTLSEITYKQGKKIAILAEMGELQNPKEEHEKIIKLIKTLDINHVITIGHLFPHIAHVSRTPHIFRAKDVYHAAYFLKKIIKKGDLIYLKGSLHRHVERVLHILEGKNPPKDLILVDYNPLTFKKYDSIISVCLPKKTSRN